MSRSHKRNVDGTLSRKSLGDRSCPRGRARCWVCSPGGHMHHVKPRIDLDRLELAEAKDAVSDCEVVDDPADEWPEDEWPDCVWDGWDYWFPNDDPLRVPFIEGIRMP